MTDPLAGLRALFLERCQTDLVRLRLLHTQGDMDGVGAIAHRLAGSAGSFGFADVGAAALTVDQQIRDKAVAPEADLERLLGLLESLVAKPTPPPSPRPDERR